MNRVPVNEAVHFFVTNSNELVPGRGNLTTNGKSDTYGCLAAFALSPSISLRTLEFAERVSKPFLTLSLSNGAKGPCRRE